ncbi:protein kinase [Candidatus Obscuribacterales bacterium]|nr:protein kinase [Candidatus Obscuribacterales bacterium]
MPSTFDVSQVQAALGLRYGNIRSIGAGGMACVFSAYDSVLARPVAVKVVAGHHAIEELAVRFQQEARLASKLHHPNIVTVLDFGRGDNGLLFLVMDLVEGGTLSQALKEHGPMPLEKAIKVFVQICDALAHAHGQGVMHRDLKPSNVMLVDASNDNSNVRIVDFGLAKVVSSDQKLTRTGVVIGTPTYSSPEQFQSKPLDHRTDIYSFGCLMFETLTKTPPFKGQNQIELFDLHVNSPVPKLAERGYTGDYSEDLDQIISTAMSKDKNDRYQSFYQLKSELLALLPEETQLLFPDNGKEYTKNKFKASSFIRQHRIALLAAAVLVAATSIFSLNAIRNEEKAVVTTKPSSYSYNGFEEKDWRFMECRKNDKDTTWTNIDCRMGDKYFKDLRGKNVRSVRLYAMRLDGWGLKYLKEEPLEKLEMPESKIKDEHLHFLGDLKKLKNLDISYSWITDKGVAQISELPNLTSLGLAGCRTLTHESIDSVQKFAPHLQRLDLSYTPVGVEGYKKLKNLPSLRDLNVSYSELNDESIKPILALNVDSLTLSRNQEITDLTLKHIERMPRLLDLKIDGCPKITNKAIQALQEARPGLKIVNTASKKHSDDFSLL